MQFIKTFQDKENVYFLTEFLGGGDLFFAIREIANLSKDQAQFYSASICLALGYLHGRGIIYRDLKPENVLLQFDGNAKLVDFGLCKKAIRTNTLVGTPEYLAPEVILAKGYTSAVDWWALGVMMHEFIVGPLPFGRDTEDQLELFREILEAPLEFPVSITDESAMSIVSDLLERSPEIRLGASFKDAKEIEEHPYFAGFDWNSVASRSMKPPWTPDTEALKINWEPQNGELLAAPGPGERITVESGERMTHESETSSPGKRRGSLKVYEPGMEWAAAF
jgi:cGMP-dependent protein kinase